MSEIRTIVRFGWIYAVANLVNSAAGLILIPLYTHLLTPEEYGVYAMVQAASDIVALIFGLGVGKAMGRYYFSYPEDSRLRRVVVSTTLLGFGGIAAVLLAAAYPLAQQLVLAIYGDTAHLRLFAVALGALVFTLSFEIGTGYLLITKRAGSFFAVACGKMVLLLGANALLVYHLRMGVPGIIYAMAFTLGTLSLALAADMLRTNGFAFSGALFLRLVGFGVPLVPSAAAQAALSFLPRYCLSSLVGSAAVGTFALADRLASLLQTFVAGPFGQIFFVRRFESLSAGDDQGVFRGILLIFVAVMATASLGLALLGPEVSALIAPRAYGPAAELLPWLGLCYALASVNVNMELGIVYERNTWAIPMIAVVTLLVSVPANYLLVGRAGAPGAAQAYVLVNILRLGLTIVANRRWGSRQVSLDWPRASAILGLSCLVGLLGSAFLGPAIGLGPALLKLLILAAFVGLLLGTPLLDRATRAQLAALRHRR